MKEIFVMLSKIMSKQQCIEKLSDAVAEYNEAKLLGKDLEQEEQVITMACHLLLLNGLKGDAKDVLEDMEMVNKSVNFFKTEKN